MSLKTLSDEELLFLIQYLRSRIKHPTMTGTSDQAILIDLKNTLKQDEREKEDTIKVS